jgi:hypothetical protein
MSVSDWVVPAVTLCGALIVSTGNYAVQRWRFRIDRLMVATDQLCNEVNSAAQRAAEYWFLEDKSEAQHAQCRRLEFELVALQSRLQQLIAAIQEQDPRLDLNEAGQSVSDLFDSMTGGQFQVVSREVDVQRARRVQANAAELSGHLRIAIARRSRSIW